MTHTVTQAPCLTFLNYTGDVTVTWDKESEAAIIELVKQKIAKGYAFFIIKPRPMAFLFGDKKVPLRTLNDLRNAKALSIPDDLVSAFTKAVKDEDVAQAMATSNIAAIPAPARDTATEGEFCRDPEVIAKSHAIATPRVVGG